MSRQGDTWTKPLAAGPAQSMLGAAFGASRLAALVTYGLRVDPNRAPTVGELEALAALGDLAKALLAIDPENELWTRYRGGLEALKQLGAIQASEAAAREQAARQRARQHLRLVEWAEGES